MKTTAAVIIAVLLSSCVAPRPLIEPVLITDLSYGVVTYVWYDNGYGPETPAEHEKWDLITKEHDANLLEKCRNFGFTAFEKLEVWDRKCAVFLSTSSRICQIWSNTRKAQCTK